MQLVVHVCGSGHGNCYLLSILSWDHLFLCLCMWVAVIVMAFTFPSCNYPPLKLIQLVELHLKNKELGIFPCLNVN